MLQNFEKIFLFFITCRVRTIAEGAKRGIAAEERRVDLLRCSEETLNMSVQCEDSVTPWNEHCLYLKHLFSTETKFRLYFILSK